MKQMTKKLLVLLLAVMMTFGCSVAYAEEGNIESLYFDAIFANMVANYKFDMDMAPLVAELANKILAEHPEMLEELVDTASNYMDQYSDYYTPEELAEFNTMFNASYVGIGVIVQRTVGAVSIVSVTGGSSAAQAGLMAGDRIVKVNGVDVTDYSVDELTPLIKGEEGTQVQITVLRGEQELTKTVTRASIRGNTVGYQKIENGIGYLQIASFNTGTPAEMNNADMFFRNNRIKKLIIDLRDNPGGEMVSVVHTLSYFVPKGKTVISVEYANEMRNTSLRSVGNVVKKPYYDKIVVLINGESASGAELFAGNIRDYKLGTLVGVTTLGKGTVQEFMSLPSIGGIELGAIKMTTAEYFLPSGEQINGKGITPDRWVANRYIRLDTSEMEPLDTLRDYKEGDSGNGVLAIKQRFDAVGYFVGEVNNQFDRELTIAVRQYQRAGGLEPTGIMDYKTMSQFSRDLDEIRFEIDEQFNTALELLKAMK